VTLVLREYGGLELELPAEDLAYLLRLTHGDPSAGEDARVIRSIMPSGRRDTFKIAAGGYVGRMGLPSGRQIDFESRFHTSEDMWNLILASQHGPSAMKHLAPQGSSSPFLVEVLAQAFLREVEAIVGGGLLKGYRSRIHDRPPYAGRIDSARHLSRFAGRPDRLVTVSRRLTADVDANQVLASAVGVLRRTPLSPLNSLRPIRIAAAFSHVQTPRMPLSTLPAVRNAAPARYRDALALAELILRAERVAPRGAGLRGASILFHTPRVWENYVTRWVRSRWPLHEVRGNQRFELTARDSPASPELWAEADTTVREFGSNQRLVALYDAKYKAITTAPSRPDIYQMVAYCERLAVNEATLVYPVATQPRAYRVGAKTVRVLGLPPPYEYMAAPVPSSGGVRWF